VSSTQLSNHRWPTKQTLFNFLLSPFPYFHLSFLA
jgi:hypothetical protein